MEAVQSSGPNNFIVARFDFTAVRTESEGNDRPPWWDKPQLTPEEAERIDQLPGIRQALYDFSFQANFDYQGHRVKGVQASAESSGWPAYTQGDFIAGRDFTPGEVREDRPIVVISDALAEELFGQRDPLDRRIQVINARDGTTASFTVVGVFAPIPNIFSSAVKYFAVFPYTAAKRRLRAADWQAQIYVVPRDSVTIDEAQDEVITALRVMRGLGPRQENNFAVLASAQILELFDRLTGVFFLVMLALSSAGLLVGGVGVIGIMLISVTERTREIGVRKAVGATRREILWQFLVEASVLTALGAAIGMLAGWGLAAVVAAFTPLPARIPLWSVFAALGMAALTGMLFGLLPAYRASRLDPVVALRYE
jgi:putative ABC transport system permease protein